MDGHFILRAGSPHDVFFKHDTAEVIGTKAQGQLANTLALRYPRALDVLDIVHIETGYSQRLHIIPTAGLFTAEFGIAGLECPGDKGAETAGLVLQAADFFHMLNALCHGFAKADNHGGRTLHANAMGAFHHVEPVFRHDFLGADPLTHFIHKDFCTAAGQAVQASFLQAFQCIENRKPCLLGKILDFRGRKRMNGNLRVFFLDTAQHIFVIVKSQIRVKATLNHDLCAACGYGFAYFLQDFLIGQQISILGFLAAEKCTESALVFAHICIVDIPVNDESHRIIKQLPPLFISADSQLNRVATLKQANAFLNRQARVLVFPFRFHGCTSR